MAPDSCPRVLINLDFAGDLGTRPDDVILLGKCDTLVRDLCRELGWEEALDREWAKTEFTLSSPSDLAVSPTITGPADLRAFRTNGLLDALPPHEQVEIGSTSNGTSTPTAAEWQEKLDAAESLTERLCVALECSEKVGMEETAITFAARTLSSEEILLANAVGDSPLLEEPPFIALSTAIAVEGRS